MIEFSTKPHVLLLEARFYAEISDMLAKGAIDVFNRYHLGYERVDVPGALEIPAALGMAQASGKYDAYVMLGCVIRGETYHFEIVCHESARGITQLATQNGLATGNGILTVENYEQAVCRADPQDKDKGGDAARAALQLYSLREQLAPRAADSHDNRDKTGND